MGFNLKMIYPYLIAIFIVITLCSIIIINHHAKPNTSNLAYFTTLVGWVISFLTIFYLPIDISFPENEPDHFLLEIIWIVIYWMSFLLSFIILPFLCSYVDSSEFTFKRKIIYSLKINLIYYLIGLGIGILYTIYLLFSGDETHILALLMAAANTYSLLMIFIFMSNGLIALPRSMFNRINLRYRFRYLVCKFYYYSKHLEDHQFNLEVAVSDAVFANQEAPLKLKIFTNQIISEIDEEYLSMKGEHRSSLFKEDSYITYEKIVAINYNVRMAITEYKAIN